MAARPSRVPANDHGYQALLSWMLGHGHLNAIARAVLGQTSTAIPKTKSGMVEVIRTPRVTRASAAKARTQASNTLWGAVIG